MKLTEMEKQNVEDIFLESPIFKKEKPKMHPFIKPVIFWDWYNFGIMFIIYKNTEHIKHHISLDIQIGWFNLWILLFNKK